MGQRPPERLIILVDSDRFDTTVQALSDAGVQVEDQHRVTGTVVGLVDSDRVSAVAELDGVLAVERDRPIQAFPPDSDLQ